MKAWLLKDQKGIGSMKTGDAFEPHAIAGEAVVEMFYAALNPADRYLAEGMYPAKPTFPHILGRDGVGKVIAVGPGIAGAKAQWKGKGVEPQYAARPSGRRPAAFCLTPQNVSPRRAFCCPVEEQNAGKAWESA